MSALSASPVESALRPSPAIRRLGWWAAFIVVGLAAHGLLLLDDGIYHDDWWIAQVMREGRFRDLHTHNTDSGHPLLATFMFAFTAFPNPVVAHKWFTFAMLVVSAGLLAKLCQAARLAPPRQALVIGLLALVLPAHRALGNLAQGGPLLGYLVLFLAAILLVLHAEPLAGAPRVWRRSVALGCFWASFYFNALLVPYVGLCLMLLAWRWYRDQSQVRQWLVDQWPFLLLPWVFWGHKLVLIGLGLERAVHESSTYNTLTLCLPSIVLVYTEAIRTYAKTVWAWMRWSTLALGAAGLGLAAVAPRRLAPETATRRDGATLASLGAVLVVLGLFPFAAVGKGIGPPGAHWSSHYGALLALPLALLTVGVLVAIFGGLTRVACILVLLIGGAAVVDSVTTHIHWQAEGIKWKAVCQQVGRSADARAASIVVVVDRWPLGMHDTVEGVEVGRLVKLGKLVQGQDMLAGGFASFFNYWCAAGAPKAAGAAGLPAVAPEQRLPDVGRAARKALRTAMEAGRLSAEAYAAAERVLDRAGPDASRTEILRLWPSILHGLERADRHPNLRLAVRERLELRLAGFPPGPAVPSRFWEAEVKMVRGWPWGDPQFRSSALTMRPQSVAVVVAPGPDYRAIPVGQPGWWPQARDLWVAYQQARFGGPDARAALLDRVAAVEVLRLAW